MKRLSAGAAAFAAAGMLVLLYAAVLSFFVRLASGLLLTALLGAVLLLTGMFYKPLKKRKWPLGLLCAAYALLLAFVLFPALYSRNDTVTYDEDVLIVLGAGLDGEAVTPQLENRLEAAYAYHLRNPDAPVVVSGGQRDGEAISEALAMERWLISRGVPADRILREEASTSTYEILTNAKALLDERSARPCRVALVTSGYHVYRASRLAKAAGLDASHLHADAEWYALPVRMLRECAAVVKYWVSGT